jgi:hypothetical protein
LCRSLTIQLGILKMPSHIVILELRGDLLETFQKRLKIILRILV